MRSLLSGVYGHFWIQGVLNRGYWTIIVNEDVALFKETLSNYQQLTYMQLIGVKK